MDYWYMHDETVDAASFTRFHPTKADPVYRIDPRFTLSILPQPGSSLLGIEPPERKRGADLRRLPLFRLPAAQSATELRIR